MPADPLCSVVHKFGGAALADAAAIANAVALVQRAPTPAVVVASAIRGATDALLDLVARATTGDADGADAAVVALTARYRSLAAALDLEDATRAALLTRIDTEFAEVARVAAGLAAVRQLIPATSDAVVACGERLSAQLLAAALTATGTPAEFVDATDVIHALGPHGKASPDFARTAVAATATLGPLLARGIVPVVPGFIAAGIDTAGAAVVTLGRGGSDLSATALARALRAPEVILWKDVPGLLTADPRVVPDARLLPRVDVREAAELAYYGAKVLHPRALSALRPGTHLRIRSFLDPDAPGTEIFVGRAERRVAGRPPRRATDAPVKAVAAIADQALVTLSGKGMAGVPGVAARAFAALDRAGVSVSLISQASSEYSICMGIARRDALAAEAGLREAFRLELRRREVDAVDVRTDVTTLAVVGLGMAGTPGVSARLFGALGDADVNVIAVAQGASELNISVVVATGDAARAQQAVHAAFRLDKIGGGRVARSTHADIVLLGFGLIGREVAAQVAASTSRAVRVVGVIDRGGYVFDPRGLAPKRLLALAAAKRGATSLADTPGGLRADALTAVRAIGAHALARPVLVDVTAGDTSPVLEAAVTCGMDVVLANKRPLAAGRVALDQLHGAARAAGRRLLHEATVGAGLPVIDTFQKLVSSGDRVLRIEGCPSGTLGYLFGELGRGCRFSTALRGAIERGYTEPDPRDDLSGMDVARKALILGRLLGFAGELDDIRVESLVPPTLRDVSVDEFLARIDELDDVWTHRVDEARAEGAVLRYRATVTPETVQVGVVTVASGSSLGALTGTDNQFAFTTDRYGTNPLVITGPGAGAAVTAAGVLNDVLKLAEAR